MDRLTADVAGLIDAAGARKTLVVGHDWGGGVAWMTAIERRRRLSGLIIMNAPHPALFAAGLLRWPQIRRSWYIFAFQIPTLPELLLRRRRARAIAGAFLRMAVDKTRFPAEVLEVYRRQALEPGALRVVISRSPFQSSGNPDTACRGSCWERVRDADRQRSDAVTSRMEFLVGTAHKPLG